MNGEGEHVAPPIRDESFFGPFAHRELRRRRGDRRHGLGARDFLGNRLFGSGARLFRRCLAEAQHLRADFLEFCRASLIGLGLDGGDLHLQPRIRFLARAFSFLTQAGFGRLADQCGFGLDRACGFLVGRFTQFACFLLTPFGRFTLRLFERALGRVCFFANTRKFRFEPGIGLGTQPFDRVVERACGLLLCLFAAPCARGVTLSGAGSLRHLVQAACLIGLEADAFDFLLQMCVSLGLDAGHFRLERDCRRFLGRLSGLFGRDFAKPFDFLLRLLLSESRLGGFLAQAFELGDQIRIGIGLDACEFGFELAGR